MMNYPYAQQGVATVCQAAQNCALGSPAPEVPTLTEHLMALQNVLCDARGAASRLRSFADRLYGPMPQDPREQTLDKDQPIAAQRLTAVQDCLRMALSEIHESLDRIERFA